MRTIGYTEGELRIRVAQERMELTNEMRDIQAKERVLERRRRAICERLGELDKADQILEGGLR